MKLTRTMTVRITATVSASPLSSLAFSPSDFAHSFHNLLLIYFLPLPSVSAAKNADTSTAIDAK